MVSFHVVQRPAEWGDGAGAGGGGQGGVVELQLGPLQSGVHVEGVGVRVRGGRVVGTARTVGNLGRGGEVTARPRTGGRSQERLETLLVVIHQGLLGAFIQRDGGGPVGVQRLERTTMGDLNVGEDPRHPNYRLPDLVLLGRMIFGSNFPLNRFVFIIRILLLVVSPQFLRLLDERFPLGLREAPPALAELLGDLSVLDVRILTNHFLPLVVGKHHECVHRSLDVAVRGALEREKYQYHYS